MIISVLPGLMQVAVVFVHQEHNQQEVRREIQGIAAHAFPALCNIYLALFFGFCGDPCNVTSVDQTPLPLLVLPSKDAVVENVSS